MLAHIKRGRAGIPLTRITPPHTHTCHKQGFGFPTSHVVAVLVFNELRREVIIFFVDIIQWKTQIKLQFLVGDIGYAFTNEFRIFYDVHGKMFLNECFKLRSKLLNDLS